MFFNQVGKVACIFSTIARNISKCHRLKEYLKYRTLLKCYFRLNSSGDQEALSACSLQLILCGGYQFYTAAYLTEKNPDIAKSMSSNFASQCGFCSPGMATKIYQKAIRNKNKVLKIKSSKEPSDDDYEAEETIKDNLCRCTGYRPILQACKDACQKYATCVDIEDIGNFI